MTPPETARLELAITELRGSMDAALARIEGRLELLVQRAEQADQRAADQAQQLRAQDGRLDTIERTMVTRGELDERDTRAQAQANERSRRTLAVLAIVVTALGIGTSAGTSILIAVITKGG